MSDSNDKKDGKLSEEDEEPDEWYDQQSSAETQTGSPIPLMESIRDKRIFSTGCSVEQTKMNDCYYDKKDWRSCKEEMELFRKCWKSKGNDHRTETKDA